MLFCSRYPAEIRAKFIVMKLVSAMKEKNDKTSTYHYKCTQKTFKTNEILDKTPHIINSYRRLLKQIKSIETDLTYSMLTRKRDLIPTKIIYIPHIVASSTQGTFL